MALNPGEYHEIEFGANGRKFAMKATVEYDEAVPDGHFVMQIYIDQALIEEGIVCRSMIVDNMPAAAFGLVSTGETASGDVVLYPGTGDFYTKITSPAISVDSHGHWLMDENGTTVYGLEYSLLVPDKSGAETWISTSQVYDPNDNPVGTAQARYKFAPIPDGAGQNPNPDQMSKKKVKIIWKRPQ